ncbi:MAG TPA: 50S ribosomal protein L10 [Candidatus Dependentiae bacterium]|nr:50S ribosomal protein L10 [Candidatus Dependentiae bacterium]
MDRQQKELVVSSLKKNFVESQASFLVDFQGLTVSQMQILRRALRKNGGELKVAKARLIKRAFAGDKTEVLVPFCKDQIGVVFAETEASTVAKVLYDFSKKQEALRLVVGFLDAQLLNSQEIVRIASLPTKKILLAQVCWAIKAPVTSLVMVLRMPIYKLLWLLKQLIEKKQKATK